MSTLTLWRLKSYYNQSLLKRPWRRWRMNTQWSSWLRMSLIRDWLKKHSRNYMESRLELSTLSSLLLERRRLTSDWVKKMIHWIWLIKLESFDHFIYIIFDYHSYPSIYKCYNQYVNRIECHSYLFLSF